MLRHRGVGVSAFKETTMAIRTSAVKDVSDGQNRNQAARGEAVSPTVIERDPTGRSACPECDGDLVTREDESFCTDCGLVVGAEHLERQPTMAQLGVKAGEEYQMESEDPFQSGRSLGSTYWRSDIDSAAASSDRARAYTRMKKQHERYAYTGNRGQLRRLDDIFNDIQLLRSELDLPSVVAEQAAAWMRDAKDERLPGGHMAWESLAAAAVLLALQKAGLSRDPEAVTQYAKTSHERLCAAARKLRIELELDVRPVRSDVITTVVEALDEDVDDETDAFARYLLTVADQEHIGSGTPRMTVAATAVYAADRVTDGKQLTQQQLVDAVSPVVDTSTSKIGMYNPRLLDAAVIETPA
jgi:transcription initiation factor TFIIB